MDDGDDKKRPQCACMNTACLQRYCLCFHAEKCCSAKCTCCGCRNIEENREEVNECVEKIKRKRGADAFMIKTTRHEVDATGSVVTGKEEMVHGCNCRKNRCKMYSCLCHRHEVGCSSKCRCTGCANTYGEKAKGVSEEEQQKVNDNVGHNGTYIGSQFSSLPESEEDRQKINDITNLNETSSGSQSSSDLLSFEKQKVNNDNDIFNETSRGSGGVLAGSIETSSLSDEFHGIVKKMLDDLQANPDSFYPTDPQIQSLDDSIFHDTFYQLLGDGDDFQHNIDPPTYQEHAQVDELPLTTCLGFAQADESQLKTCQGFAQADESRLKTCQGFAQADESQLKTCQDITQPDESQLSTHEESAQAGEPLLNNSKDASNLHTVDNDSQNNTGEGDH